MPLLRHPWNRIKDFAGYSGDATYFWPRWLLLRAVGAVYLIIFFGIVQDASGLVGANGLTPVAEFCTRLREIFPHGLERFLRAPSLFWLGSSPGMVAVLPWVGVAAAAAVLLNLWPRLALFICWAVHLSFVATWQLFSPTIIDQLMLEVALLCIPFAPAGLRPGLGLASPPAPIALLSLRWLLFRVMLLSGLIKLFAGDPHWRDFSAMEVLYETSPSPTILGYYDFHLPHAYHVFEIALTFVAELAAPFLALFGGTRARWFALAAWIALQAGIQLTGNFGWLNTAAIGLGLILLDDRMLATAAHKFRLSRLANAVAAVTPAALAPLRAATWRSRTLTAALILHAGLTLYFSAITAFGNSAPPAPELRTRPLDFVFRDFRSANGYVPFASFPTAKYELEFAGTSDYGATWRTYPFRHKPQAEDRMCGFLAPRFGRFDASLQLALTQNSFVIPRIAEQLLKQNPDVLRLFAGNPFPDGPPHVVRMLVHRYTFTDLATLRATGHYWKKEYAGDLRLAYVRETDGRIHEEGSP